MADCAIDINWSQRHNEVVNFHVAVNGGVNEDVMVILMGNSCEQPQEFPKVNLRSHPELGASKDFCF